MSTKAKICFNCKYFCDWEHTYIKQERYSACCSYWHIAYHKSEFDYVSCRVKSCFVPKNVPVQLNLFNI